MPYPARYIPVRASDPWPPIVDDAKASSEDLRALEAYRFRAERFRELDVPVLLQIGSESPRHLYVTELLAALLPDVRVGVLQVQAHEGMTTAPDLYAQSVIRFFLESAARKTPGTRIGAGKTGGAPADRMRHSRV